jgi:hypothetical protein
MRDTGRLIAEQLAQLADGDDSIAPILAAELRCALEVVACNHMTSAEQAELRVELVRHTRRDGRPVMTGQRVAAELVAELEQAKRSNVGCILHAEHRRQPEPSVWAQPRECRSAVMRRRCGRPRRLES